MDESKFSMQQTSTWEKYTTPKIYTNELDTFSYETHMKTSIELF